MNFFTLFALPLLAADWSAPAEIYHDERLALTFRAAIVEGHVVVEAKPEAGWHTYSMDNAVRQAEALAGKKSLGGERPIEIIVSGAAVGGEWRQTEPKDFSKPELRLYSWGYDHPALFAAPLNSPPALPVQVTVKGQACTETVCKNVTVTLDVPVDAKPGPAVDLKPLVAVRRPKS